MEDKERVEDILAVESGAGLLLLGDDLTEAKGFVVGCRRLDKDVTGRSGGVEGYCNGFAPLFVAI